jgi:hypothetical protein
MLHRNFKSRRVGQQIPEFAAVLVLLILCVLVPLINLAVVPIRYALGGRLVSAALHKLCMSDKLSDALANDRIQASLSKSLLEVGGISLVSANCELVISNPSKPDKPLVVSRVKSIPADWLPNGGNCPCDYALNLKVDTKISPFITTSIAGLEIPALNAPIPISFEQIGHWENLGRDPATGEFYLNQ